jgi:hypothetical protein
VIPLSGALLGWVRVDAAGDVLASASLGTGSSGYPFAPALSPAHDRVYVHLADQLVARTFAGATVWTASVAGVGTPAVAADGAIVLATGDGGLECWEPSGVRRWRIGYGEVLHATPAIGPDGTIYFARGVDLGGGTHALRLHALAPADGAELWSEDVGTDISTVFTRAGVTVDPTGTVLVRYAAFWTSANHWLAAFGPDHLRWKLWLGTSANSTVYASPAIGPDGTIYLTKAAGELAAYGARAWGVACSSCGPAASGWASLGGDGARRAASPATLPTSIAQKTRIAASCCGAAEASTVIDGAGNVFAMQPGKLLSVTSTGGARWSATYGDASASFYEDDTGAVTADGTMLVTRADGIHAISTADASELWTLPGLTPSAIVQGDDGSLYFHHDSHVWAVDPDGAVRFAHYTGGCAYADACVAVSGSLVAVGGAAGVTALTTDGDLLWTAAAPGGYRPSITHGGRIVVGTTSAQVRAFEPDGTPAWTFATAGNVTTGLAVGADDAVYAIGVQNGTPHWINVYAINTNGTQRWLDAIQDWSAGSLTLASGPAVDAAGKVVFHYGTENGTCYGHLFAVNATGNNQWSIGTGGGSGQPCPDAQPAIASDGQIWINGGDGALYRFGAP